MLNSIVLSSDMEMLYLIDNGRAIEFPLSEKGLFIGLLNDQITVATATKTPIPIPDLGDESVVVKDDRIDVTEITRPRAKMASKAVLPLPDPPLFPNLLKIGLDRSQWTISFNPERGYLFAIGATDIDFDRPDIQLKPRIHIFALRKGVLQLYKKDKVIYFNFLQKG